MVSGDPSSEERKRHTAEMVARSLPMVRRMRWWCQPGESVQSRSHKSAYGEEPPHESPVRSRVVVAEAGEVEVVTQSPPAEDTAAHESPKWSRNMLTSPR